MHTAVFWLENAVANQLILIIFGQKNIKFAHAENYSYLLPKLKSTKLVAK